MKAQAHFQRTMCFSPSKSRDTIPFLLYSEAAFPYHSLHSASAPTYRHLKQRYGSLCLLEILENYLLPARPRWLWSARSWRGGGRSPHWFAASPSPTKTGRPWIFILEKLIHEISWHFAQIRAEKQNFALISATIFFFYNNNCVYTGRVPDPTSLFLPTSFCM